MRGYFEIQTQLQCQQISTLIHFLSTCYARISAGCIVNQVTLLQISPKPTEQMIGMDREGYRRDLNMQLTDY